jgi:hypothetical protein
VGLTALSTLQRRLLLQAIAWSGYGCGAALPPRSGWTVLPAVSIPPRTIDSAPRCANSRLERRARGRISLSFRFCSILVNRSVIQTHPDAPNALTAQVSGQLGPNRRRRPFSTIPQGKRSDSEPGNPTKASSIRRTPAISRCFGKGRRLDGISAVRASGPCAGLQPPCGPGDLSMDKNTCRVPLIFSPRSTILAAPYGWAFS